MADEGRDRPESPDRPLRRGRRYERPPVRRDLIETNPCKDLDIKLGTLSQADRQRSIRALTYEQMDRFRQAFERHCNRRDATLFRTLTDTGLRPSEALALRWADVDTTARTLRVEHAVGLGGQIKPTKTESVRTVRLSLPLTEALSGWHRHVLRRPESSEYVFPSRTGTLLSAKRVGRQFRALLRLAGLPPFKLYDLRHSFASHLLDQGVKITDVAKLLGHAKPRTTLAFYAHPLHADDVSHIDRLMAARQAVHQANDHLNDQIVRTTQTRKPENVGKKW
jgi:integrase